MRAAAASFACFVVICAVLRPCHAEPSDAEVERRLSRIERVLAEDQPKARTWRVVWLIAFGALSAGQGVAAFALDDPGMRAEAKVGAVKSGLGFGSVLLRPFRPGHASSDLAELPETTPRERREKLQKAEKLLEESAEDEELGTGWLAHVAASAVNLAGTYYLWIEHERFAGGWLALGSGMAVSEVQIYTHPTGALDAKHELVSEGPRKTSASFTLTPSGPALFVRGSF
jgi:hypothetical protein